jgi:hypothetical protein
VVAPAILPKAQNGGKLNEALGAWQRAPAYRCDRRLNVAAPNFLITKILLQKRRGFFLVLFPEFP